MGMNKNTMNAMKIARDAMGVENPDKMIEEVEEVQEDLQEAMDIQKEFADLLSAPLVDYDENELNAELAELDDEMRDDGLVYGHVGVDVRKANIKKVTEEEEVSDNEEEEIKKLEMEMNFTFNKVLVAC